MDGRTAVLAKQELQQALPKGTKLSVERRELEDGSLDHGVRIEILETKAIYWRLEHLHALVARLNTVARAARANLEEQVAEIRG